MDTLLLIIGIVMWGVGSPIAGTVLIVFGLWAAHHS